VEILKITGASFVIHSPRNGRPIETDSETLAELDSRNGVTELSEIDSPWINRQASEQATRAAQARRSSTRRRHIDPATSERNYDEAELEFMNAMQEYKARSGRLFPTWSEVLEVLKALGYEKRSALGCQVTSENVGMSS